MDFSHSINGGVCKITMTGKLMFSDNQRFKDIIAILRNHDVSSIILDFKQVEFIDSAGLGMLLMAREEATNANKELVLSNPQGQVKKMFEITKFTNIFIIINS